MNLPCEIIQDLLPLQEDHLCSEASRAAIETHLKECPACRALVDRMRSFQEPELSEAAISSTDKAVANSFRKVHRRWLASLLIILFLIPLGILSITQARCKGVCFTNLDEIWIAGSYVHALADGNFEKAASFMDYEYLYDEIQEILSKKPEDFEKSFQRVTLGGNAWLVTGEYYEDYFLNETEEQAIWNNLIFNNVPNILIPIDIWEEAMAQQPEVFQKQEDGSYEKDGVVYSVFECEWGTFMTESISSTENGEHLCTLYDLLPAQIYEEEKTALKAEALHCYQEIQDTYAAVRDMTLEHFETFMQDSYACQLREYANWGYSIKITGLDESYYFEENGNWHIGYGIVLSDDAHSSAMTLTFLGGNGKVINLGAAMYKSGSTGKLEDNFIEALILTYPK